MALRKGSAYRHHERPYTRKSRKKSKSYIKTIPGTKIVKYVMGHATRKFSYKVVLVSREDVQVRDNAIESVRTTVNRVLEKKLGIGNYRFTVRVHPHHILREHKMLTGAGADRMQSGMKNSFGKPTNRAARVRAGDELFIAEVGKANLEIAKFAMKRAKAKIPGSVGIVMEKVGVV